MSDILERLRAPFALTEKDVQDAVDEITRLREALKPFSNRLEDLEKSPLTKYACATLVEIEHLRAAAAAIREGGKDEN